VLRTVSAGEGLVSTYDEGPGYLAEHGDGDQPSALGSFLKSELVK
jgi:hypothetical protein